MRPQKDPACELSKCHVAALRWVILQTFLTCEEAQEMSWVAVLQFISKVMNVYSSGMHS